MIQSSVWVDITERNVFLTALLMARLREFREPEPVLDPETGRPAGWELPPGWYGVAPAAGPGIVAASLVDRPAGMAALVRMSQPEAASRSQEFEGRRVVRVDGGFVVLGYMRFRDHDYTGAERQARYRARQKAKSKPKTGAPTSAITRQKGHRLSATERKHIEHMPVMTSNKAILK